ncbi:MAG: hypothetical protein AAF850_02095 [Pseudomonadota bacterium]
MNVHGISLRLIQQLLIVVAAVSVLLGFLGVAISSESVMDAMGMLDLAFYYAAVPLACAALIEIGMRIWIVLFGADQS